MTDKKLRRLRRAALLQLLIEQMEENERLAGQLSEANAKLEERRIAVAEAGSIAEAAMALNGVFAAAQGAAEQYVENVKARHAECEDECLTLVAQARDQAERILAEAQARADSILAGAGQSAARPLPAAEPQQDVRQQMEDRFDEVFAQMRRRNR